MGIARAIVVGAALAGAALPQGRHAHPGVVVDADGRPVADAEVSLAFVPAFEPLLGGGELVHARTDAQGRFRAELRDGADYFAWANAGDAASPPVDVVPGDRCELRLGAPGSGRRTLPIDRQQWPDSGPLRLRIVLEGARGLFPELALGDGGAVALPALPDLPTATTYWFELLFEVLDARGNLVESLRGCDAKPTLGVDRPWTVSARVIDDRGQPVVGAAIARRAVIWATRTWPSPPRENAWLAVCGVTDADGKATFRCGGELSGAQGEFPLLVAGQRGFLAGTGVAPPPPASSDIRELGRTRTVQFTLVPARVRTGRLLVPTGATLPARIVIGVRARASRGVGGAEEIEWNVPVAVDADGRFELPPLPAGAVPVCAVVPGAGPRLPADDPCRRAVTLQPLAVPVPDAGAAADTTLDLARLQPVRLQVLDAARGPARHARVIVAPLVGARYSAYCASSPGQTDAAGHLAFALPPGRWFLLAIGDDSYGLRELEVGATAPPLLQLALTPLPSMPLRIVDGDDKPVAGARIVNVGMGWTGEGDAVAHALYELAVPITSTVMASVRSAADGTCTIRSLLLKGMYARFAVSQGGRNSPQLEIAEHAAPVEVRLGPPR